MRKNKYGKQMHSTYAFTAELKAYWLLFFLKMPSPALVNQFSQPRSNDFIFRLLYIDPYIAVHSCDRYEEYNYIQLFQTSLNGMQLAWRSIAQEK